MILTREDIENIADNVIDDFVVTTGINTGATAIDQLATNYLGLRVTFEKLSNDGKFCGVTAYRDTLLQVKVDGYLRVICIKQNQIILDSDFMEVGKIKELCGKRRFTLAHEVAHQILFQMENDENKIRLDNEYSKREAHTVRQLKTVEDWNEWQANALGAALLMPRKNVENFMREYKKQADKLSELQRFFALYEVAIMNNFCQYFHVSKSAAEIRLKHLGYNLRETKTYEREVAYGC